MPTSIQSFAKPSVASRAAPIRPSRSRGGLSTPTWIAAGALAFFILIAIVGPWIMPYPPADVNLVDRLMLPSPQHLLGTDDLGRDILSRLIEGARVSLLACAQAVAIAVVLGVPTGLLAGYIGGTLDSVFSRITDGLISLPGMLVALAIIGTLGPGLTNAMFAIGLLMSPRFFRLARIQAASARQEGYVEALRALGVSNSRIIFRHVLPNSSGPLLVEISITGALAITAEASLSFLGLGVQPPTASWGGMIRSASGQSFRDSVWPLIPPSVTLVLLTLALMYLGQGIARRQRLGGRS